MIKIVIAEDQKMMLGALSSLLDLEDDISVLATASNGQDAEKAVREYNPDVCLLDIEMPKMSGLEAAEKLADHPCRILILTTFSRSGYFQRAVKAGVLGYMLKDSPSEDLADAIRKIMQGKKVYAPELIDHVYSSVNPLTDREIDVLELMAKGKSTKAIATELFLTNGTVRNYISSILEKLEVDNRIEAITVYKEKGWSK
ncbi:response regulator transcription factor [Salisediminibacterium halotolerans]|uniref:response regulator transcription factor n=1 Tax=Salisediminibacterium halotolerans TaxID=517425 RepID=UPI000EB1E8D4|nr:response regulator transcription factor [Salisediminibacterium halotolerans]RLJ69698.1 LuxR family two component transcriptional regulator [Actinophytocola xinjiangensis]RPE89756.1 LuxR family two component transcriptional regulator [Salisediminibacterium halotolerans]TWG32592.1 LuxR family two component transcriptional regulator [Salisediminibacterium halotolerans]GEL08967.1 transcriptional regulatory protein DesR [Salisediminibacterium halotolerans]